MRPSASASISPRVSGVSGQWRVTKSELSSSSPRGTPPLRPVCSRRTPKPSSRRATALPIRPIPTIPTVVSCRSRPSMKSGPQVVHSPRRTSASPSVSPPGDPEHEGHGEVGRAVREHVRRVSHRDPAGGGRLQVHVVHAHGVVRDGPKQRRRLQQLRRHRVGEHREQSVALGGSRPQRVRGRRSGLGPDLHLVRRLEASQRVARQPACDECPHRPPRSSITACAARYPGAPVTAPPGCAPDPPR